MATVSKIDGVEVASIANIDGIALASISKYVDETIETGLGQVANNFSMDFDGINSHVAAGYTGAVTSCSLWFKPDATITTASLEALISFQDGANYAGIYLGNITSGISNELITVLTNSTSNKSYYAQVGGTINTDWHHLVISHTGTQYNIYLDNVNVFTNNSGGNVALITATRCDIGCRILSGGVTLPFAGLIDEVAVFDYELSASDVDEIYNATDTNLTADLSSMSTPPVAWYRMGD